MEGTRETTELLTGAKFDLQTQCFVPANSDGSPILAADGQPVTSERPVLVFTVPGHTVQIPFDPEPLAAYVKGLIAVVVGGPEGEQRRRELVESLTGGIVLPMGAGRKGNGGAMAIPKTRQKH